MVTGEAMKALGGRQRGGGAARRRLSGQRRWQEQPTRHRPTLPPPTLPPTPLWRRRHRAQRRLVDFRRDGDAVAAQAEHAAALAPTASARWRRRARRSGRRRDAARRAAALASTRKRRLRSSAVRSVPSSANPPPNPPPRPLLRLIHRHHLCPRRPWLSPSTAGSATKLSWSSPEAEPSQRQPWRCLQPARRPRSRRMRGHGRRPVPRWFDLTPPPPPRAAAAGGGAGEEWPRAGWHWVSMMPASLNRASDQGEGRRLCGMGRGEGGTTPRSTDRQPQRHRRALCRP